ncbi:hypothetical protein MP228_009213 [Amoeboaphelidium protococcarum]|nr:hypothetical protein MP228_009213 [Amoeboaphelidium protococcarum]
MNMDLRVRSAAMKYNDDSSSFNGEDDAQEEDDHLQKYLHSLQMQTEFYLDLQSKQNALFKSRIKEDNDVDGWRNKEKLKTVGVLISLCLNLGVDPPDVIKPTPCAVMEAWIDPFSKELSSHPLLHVNGGGNGGNAQVANNNSSDDIIEGSALQPQKAVDLIAKILTSHYEPWQPRARYKMLTDPTPEDLKKTMLHLRRNAAYKSSSSSTSSQQSQQQDQSDRVLWHYNGHGVPKPTVNGELWFFNKTYTQYVPVGIGEVNAWLGSPSIIVLDCSAAGNFVNAYLKHYSKNSNTIILAACHADQTLPMHPALPADLFTACLTTPIQAALHWFMIKNNSHVPLQSQSNVDYIDMDNVASSLLISSQVTPQMLQMIPGKVSDRRTMLGELNWIFTAITDSIAWDCLSQLDQHGQKNGDLKDYGLFKKLYRQDLMVAALFRNFLLARRVMKFYGVNPISYPSLDFDAYIAHQIDEHYLWESWDLVCEVALNQLPGLLNPSPPRQDLVYVNSSFFEDQLNAFELWLEEQSQFLNDRMNNAKDENGSDTSQVVTSPHLPIILQVLLSQHHRLRASLLLSRYLDLSPHNVREALDVGIFPYVLKLLQSPAVELRMILVFIWCKICAWEGFVDGVDGCKAELLSSGSVGGGFMYFVTILSQLTSQDNDYEQYDGDVDNGKRQQSANALELEAMCLFILIKFTHKHLAAQVKLLQLKCGDLSFMKIVIKLLDSKSPQVQSLACQLLGSLVSLGDHSLAVDNKQQVNSGGKTSRSNSNASLQYCQIVIQSRLESFQTGIHEDLFVLLTDDAVEVRSAAVYALGQMLSAPKDGIQSVLPADTQKQLQNYSRVVGLTILSCCSDASSMVRLELISALSQIVHSDTDAFIEVAHGLLQDEREKRQSYSNSASSSLKQSSSLSSQSAGFEKDLTQKLFMQRHPNFQHQSYYQCLWKSLLVLSMDAMSSVAKEARLVVDFITYHTLVKDHKIQNYSGSRPSLTVAQLLQQSNNQDSTASLPVGFGKSLADPGRLMKNNKIPIGSTSKSRSSAYIDSQQFNAKSLQESLKRTSSLKKLTSNQFQSSVNKIFAPSHVSEEGQSRAYNGRLSKQKSQQEVAQSGFDKDSDQLPLASFSLQLSLQSYRKSVLSRSDLALPGGTQFMERVSKLDNLSRVVDSVRSQVQQRQKFPFEHRMAMIDSAMLNTSILNFHAVEDWLLSVHNGAVIRVWDYTQSSNRKISSFKVPCPNKNASHVTCAQFINEVDRSLIAVASNDGQMRIYEGIGVDKKPAITTAWTALPELFPDETGSGMIFKWNQQRGDFMVGGDVRQIRLWSAVKQLNYCDIPTKSLSSLTCLDEVDDNVLLAGFGDGTVRAYDKRLDSRQCMVMQMEEHKEWVLSVRQQRGADRMVVSASTDSVVKILDFRTTSVLESIVADGGKSVSCMALHDFAPVMAIGSELQFVKVMQASPSSHTTWNNIRYNDEGLLMGQRIASVSCIAFHPHKLMMAFGGMDQMIPIYNVQSGLSPSL